MADIEVAAQVSDIKRLIFTQEWDKALGKCGAVLNDPHAGGTVRQETLALQTAIKQKASAEKTIRDTLESARAELAKPAPDYGMHTRRLQDAVALGSRNFIQRWNSQLRDVLDEIKRRLDIKVRFEAEQGRFKEAAAAKNNELAIRIAQHMVEDAEINQQPGLAQAAREWINQLGSQIQLDQLANSIHSALERDDYAGAMQLFEGLPIFALRYNELSPLVEDARVKLQIIERNLDIARDSWKNLSPPQPQVTNRILSDLQRKYPRNWAWRPLYLEFYTHAAELSNSRGDDHAARGQFEEAAQAYKSAKEPQLNLAKVFDDDPSLKQVIQITDARYEVCTALKEARQDWTTLNLDGAQARCQKVLDMLDNAPDFVKEATRVLRQRTAEYAQSLNTADLQQFITDYFSDDELTTMCFDFFPEADNSFASGMSKGQKIQLLIEYLQRREQLPSLLWVLQQQRPMQYAKRFDQIETTPVERLRSASPVIDPLAPHAQSIAESSRLLRVFLCHATNDKPAVRELHRRLHADGFEPWLDEEDILPGQHWQVEIPKAVHESDVVLVCLSQHSINKTGYVQKEIKFALDVADEQPDGTIFLIPLRLEACDVPDRLSHVQWVNFYDEGGYPRLLRALRKRAADLNASTTAASTKPASPAAPEARGPAVSNVSGGVTLESVEKVNVGGDVTGRDKIIQAGTYIEHATIIQPSSPPSAPNMMTWGGLEFVRVPAGKFLMGSKDDNKLAYDNERPQHTVEISYDYWIGKYPVTNEQFAQFVAAARYKFDQGDWQKKTNHPVVNVTWRVAMAYCQWLNEALRGELKDRTLRLPTEAEWEKAARGEYGNEWPWGNEFDKNKCNSSEGGKGGTTPVGAYSANGGDSPYGAADMVGNVWEWCHSIYKPYPYQADDSRENEAGDNSRVLRGGAFSGNHYYARCAFRGDSRPADRSGYFGWRVVVSRAPE